MSSVRGSVDDYLDYIARRPPNEGRPAAIAFRVREAMALGRPIRLRCGAGAEPSGVVVRMTSSGSPTYALTVEFESGETVALDRVTDVGPAL